jgi:hypothetical protein
VEPADWRMDGLVDAIPDIGTVGSTPAAQCILVHLDVAYITEVSFSLYFTLGFLVILLSVRFSHLH